MSLAAPTPAPPIIPPAAVPPPPMFGESPTGKKPQAKSTMTTFLGTGAAPQSANLGFKTLLGT